MKLNLSRLFDNRTLMKLCALLLAVLSWLVVVYAIYPDTDVVIKGVPVDIVTQQEEYLDPNGLQIVDVGSLTVDVAIQGNRRIISGVKPGDIDIVANLSGITGPGVYDNITLSARKQDGRKAGDKYDKGFTLWGSSPISPSNIRVQVERLKKKKFPISTDISGVKFPEGYISSETKISPGEVTITGPETAVNKVEKCLASAAFTDPLTSTRTVKSSILLFDAEGNEIPKEQFTMDTDSVDITVPILKQKLLPVNFQFIGEPSGFPIEDLDYKFVENGAINVAGPEAVIDNLDVLDLGYIRLDEITKDQNTFIFPVDLPEGVKNLDDINTIAVQFDIKDMVEAVYTIPGSNIFVSNVPINYNVTVNTPSISNVKIIGDAKMMEALSGRDIVAEIDLSDGETHTGPYSLTAHISVPGKGLVWATGGYTAMVTITEK